MDLSRDDAIAEVAGRAELGSTCRVHEGVCTKHSTVEAHGHGVGPIRACVARCWPRPDPPLEAFGRDCSGCFRLARACTARLPHTSICAKAAPNWPITNQLAPHRGRSRDGLLSITNCSPQCLVTAPAIALSGMVSNVGTRSEHDLEVPTTDEWLGR